MYKYNSNINYQPNGGDWPGLALDLHKQKIYVNGSQYIDIAFNDIFREYVITSDDRWSLTTAMIIKFSHRQPELKEYFMFYRCQLNFSIHCATTALGISSQHLTHGSELLKSIYKFHVYYHVRRILKRLDIPLPHTKTFSKYSNPYDWSAYQAICNEYGVNPSNLWLTGDWMYTNNNANFFENGNTTTKSTTKPPSGDYSRWIIPTSNGLTYKALNLLSDSVRGYVYLLLSSQSGARRNIMESPAARQIYLDNFNDIVERQVETAADIERYQNVLRYAYSKVDFGIAKGVYMIPSNMMLNMDNMGGYNNKLLIADSNVKIGMVNIDINQKSIEKESTPKQLPQETSSRSKNPYDDGLLSENDRKLAKEHVEEKESLIIVGICFIVFGYAFF